MVYQDKYKKRGFTLVEVIVVIAIFAVFSSISIFSYSGFKNRNILNIAAYDTIDAMRHAQGNAQKMKKDSQWGVKVFSDKVVIFKGTTYASRDTAFDQNLDFPEQIDVSGSTEIVFDKITGWTDDVGTTTVTGTDGSSKQIFINEKGTITY